MNNDDLLIDETLLLDLQEYNKNRRNNFLNDTDFDVNLKLERILKARYNKCSRIKKRLVYLFSKYKYIWFITFTFDDDLIKKCDRTKRDTIKKCLNHYDFKYILNVDYGSQTEREHYHCILATDYNINIDEYFKQLYPCYLWAKPCRKDKANVERLHKYINKFTNHAIKDTTKNKRIVYNFKGFDSLSNDSYSKRIMYVLCYDEICKV